MDWLEDRLNAGNLPEGSDQFNSLQEKLIDRFVELREQYGFQLLHLPAVATRWRSRNHSVLQDCATEAEIATEFLYIDDIGLGEKVVHGFTGSGISTCSNVSVGIYVVRCSQPSWRMQAYAGWNRRGRALSPTRHFYRYCGDVPESPEPAPAYLRKMIIRKWKICG